MSTLRDFFTSLANKVRSKLGTSTTYTPAQAVNAIDDVYTKGVTDTKVGTATAGDVLSGKTFTNSSSVGASGSMTNNGAISQSLNCGGSYTVPAGYHNGSGKVTANSLASQTGVTSGKGASAGTIVSGYEAWVSGSKITGTFAAQEKSASPSTSAQTITPDSGKYLSKVSISAISPQRSANTAATTAGRDSSGPYVYFPYGWWPQANATYGNYTRLTEAQGVAVARKQEKTVTSSRSAQTVTPDSNYVLSKVTVNALAPTGTFNAGTTRSTSIDMGATSNYRYVNTNGVSNTNSGTYTPSTHGTALDMGATNTYRYVNTTNAYNAGANAVKNGGVQNADATSVGWYSSGNTSYGHVHMPEQYYKKGGADWAPEIRLTKSQINEMSNASGINTENYNNGYTNGRNDGYTAGRNDGYTAGSSAGQEEVKGQLYNECNGAVPNLLGCLRVINSLYFHHLFRLVIRSGYIDQIILAQIGESGSSGRPWEQNGGSMDTSYWENTLGYVRDDNGGPSHTYYGFPDCGALYGGKWADFCCYNVSTMRFFVLYIAITANYL